MMNRKLGWRAFIVCLVWLGFIFGTSCTVIRPQEFFGLLQTFTGFNADNMQRFELFWGASWFLIVKGWHFTEFAILLFLCVGAAHWWNGKTTEHSILWAALFCLLFAMTDEWHQTFVPDRYGTVQDVCIDGLGIAAASGFLLLRLKSQHIRLRG